MLVAVQLEQKSVSDTCMARTRTNKSCADAGIGTSNAANKAKVFIRGLTLELTRRRPELIDDNKPDPGGRVE